MSDISDATESERRKVAYAIGHIMMMWGNIEMILGHCLADVLDVQRGKAVLLLAGASGRRRVEHLQSLVKKGALKLGDDTLLFENTLKEIYELEEQRNVAAHSVWVAYDDDGELARVRFSRQHDGRNLSYSVIDAEKLAALGDTLAKALNTLGAIWSRRFPGRIPLLQIPEMPSPESSGARTQP